MKLLLASLESMLQILQAMKEADDYVIARIDRIDNINYRQQLVLQRAIVAPKTEFYITPHSRTHNIVYSTARADLEQLVERGFFIRTLRDSANTYQAAPDFRTVLLKTIEDIPG